MSRSELVKNVQKLLVFVHFWGSAALGRSADSHVARKSMWTPILEAFGRSFEANMRPKRVQKQDQERSERQAKFEHDFGRRFGRPRWTQNLLGPKNQGGDGGSGVPR